MILPISCYFQSWLQGFPRWFIGKGSACQCRRHRFDPWVRKIPWRKKWHVCVCMRVRVCVCVCVCVCIQLFNLIKCLLLSKVGHFLFRKILTKLKLFFLEQRIIKPTRDLIYPLIKHFKDLWKKVQKKQKIIIGFISGGFYY